MNERSWLQEALACARQLPVCHLPLLLLLLLPSLPLLLPLMLLHEGAEAQVRVSVHGVECLGLGAAGQRLREEQCVVPGCQRQLRVWIVLGVEQARGWSLWAQMLLPRKMQPGLLAKER